MADGGRSSRHRTLRTKPARPRGKTRVSGRIEIRWARSAKRWAPAAATSAAAAPLIDYLVNRARPSFIFSTAPVPAAAAAARAGIQLVQSSEAQFGRTTLETCCRIPIGHRQSTTDRSERHHSVDSWRSAKAVETAAQLREQGFFVPAIRYPTVARGAARLRITLTTAHTKPDVETCWRAVPKSQFVNRKSQMHRLARLDHAHVWHPFTQMRDWLKTRTDRHHLRQRRSLARCSRQRNTSTPIPPSGRICTAIQHPKINAAITRQLKRFPTARRWAFANEPASLLAAKLVQKPTKIQIPKSKIGKGFLQRRRLDRAGSCAQAGLRIHPRRTRGPKPNHTFSRSMARITATPSGRLLGHINLFHKAYGGMLLKQTRSCHRIAIAVRLTKPSRSVPMRAPIGSATGNVSAKWSRNFPPKGNAAIPYAAFVFEPLMQGAAGMIPQPDGWLKHRDGHCTRHDTLLIADEVMTGFGRTGVQVQSQSPKSICLTSRRFAAGFLCIAKGLTGGYLPMAATLTTQHVVLMRSSENTKSSNLLPRAQLHRQPTWRERRRAGEHGDSGEPAFPAARAKLKTVLAAGWRRFGHFPNVGDIRRVCLVAGIELVRDWRRRRPFEAARARRYPRL